MRWEGDERGRSISLSLSLSRSRSPPPRSLSWEGLSATVGDLLLYWLACWCSMSKALDSEADLMLTVGLERDFSPSSPLTTLLP